MPAGLPSAAAPARTPPLPPLLQKCERWIKLAGRTVHRAVAVGVDPAAAKGPAPSGKEFAVLAVEQGAVPVMVRVVDEPEEILEIFVAAPIPKEIRDRLAKAPPELRVKVLLAVRHELLSSTRTGFGILPATATSMEQVEVISVNQQICVKGGRGAEVTRLLDGLIEVATAMLRAGAVLSPIATGGSGTSTTSTASPTDTDTGPGRMFG
ncbi:MAG: hypothetical protein ACLPWO_05360 [Thermoplasmata archaeon]